MNLSDFEFGGFTSFARTFTIVNLAEAKKAAKFLNYESLIEHFKDTGPGKYFCQINEGWDRGGDYGIYNVVFIPEVAMSFTDTIKEMKRLKKVYDVKREPFCIASDLQHNRGEKTHEEAVAELSPKERKLYESMDCDAVQQAECDMENFMNGHNIEVE